MTVTPHGHGGGGAASLPVEFLSKVLLYAALGAAYALAGFWKKREQGRRDHGAPVSFSVRRAGRTTLIGAVAGAVVAWQGQEFSGANLDLAMGIAVPIVDQFFNRERAKKERYGQLEQAARERNQ